MNNNMPARPSKKKTETTFKEEAAAKEQLERANRERAVAQQIQDVLELAGYTLQPFMAFSEFGVVPRVRLVPNPEAKNDQGTDSGEGSDDSKGTESPEPSES